MSKYQSISWLIVSTTFVISCLFGSNAMASITGKANGKMCKSDGQCASRECKLFRCVNYDPNAKPTGNDKIEGLLNQFDKAVPVINQAGFEVMKIRVEVRKVPVVSIYLRQTKGLSKSQKTALLDKYGKNLFLLPVLKALFTAHAFEFKNYRLTDSILQLNPPRVTVFLHPI